MGLTKAEAEDRAKRLLRKAGMDMFMELESLACCQESNRVFLVLKCKGTDHVADRAGSGYSSTSEG